MLLVRKWSKISFFIHSVYRCPRRCVSEHSPRSEDEIPVHVHAKEGSPAHSPLRSMDIPVKFRAQSRTSKPKPTVTIMEEDIAEVTETSLTAPPRIAGDPLLKRHAGSRIEDVDAPDDISALNEVQVFLEHVDLQTEQARYDRNQAIPFPRHPDEDAPEFRRIKRHQKQVVVSLSEKDDRPVFVRRDAFVPLPPSPTHPWVGKHTPIGPHIVHGDGQLNIVGTGEVGFEDLKMDSRDLDRETREARRQWRGLQFRSVVQCSLPQFNATIPSDLVVKHSFSLTGRGVFATKPIRKGETILISKSTARSVGVKGETERLEEMVVHVLNEALTKKGEYLRYLHDWVLTGQPSSLLEHWPVAATNRVIETIGGVEKLDELELHPLHISRMAAIMDLNSFLLESSYAERKGMSYFPEAGFFNHSCIPNATYEIVPEHTFEESDYYVDEMQRDEEAQEGQDSLIPSEVATQSKERAERRLASLLSGSGRELTECGAPQYLFCCRAEKDIEAGEEILISYVPAEWSFDNRQYVLHDRYRFYCKCPRCSPTIDSQYARVPRLLVVLVVCSIALQLLLIRMRNRAGEAFDDQGNFKDPDPGKNRMGLFELLEKEKIEQANTYPGMERLPAFITDDYVKK